MAELPAWPDYALPAPSLNDDLAQQYPDIVVRTDFEQGPSMQRNLYQSGATTQWITWPMDAVQQRIFHGFWRNALNNGTDWFTLPIFNDDDYRIYKVRFVSAGQPVKITRSGAEWIYGAQIETADETAPDEYETAELLITYGSDLPLDAIVGVFRDAVQSIYQ